MVPVQGKAVCGAATEPEEICAFGHTATLRAGTKLPVLPVWNPLWCRMRGHTADGQEPTGQE